MSFVCGFQVSDEVGLTSNDDDVDLDLDEDVTMDVKEPVNVKSSTAKYDLADEMTDRTHLSTASSAACEDSSAVTLNPESNDHKVSVEPPNEASCESSSESLPQTCSVSLIADSSLQTMRNIPGKALPVVVDSAYPELSTVDMKPNDPVSDAQYTTEVQSEAERSRGLASSTVPDICTTDVKNSQQSKKCDTKSVSMSTCNLVG